MAYKNDLPAFWDRITDGDYPSAAVTVRMRLLSAAGLLPPRRAPVMDHEKAAFLIGLYASRSHVDAACASARFADLAYAVQESRSGRRLAESARLFGCFQDVLTRVIQDFRLQEPSFELWHLEISSAYPEARIALTSRAGDPSDTIEIYRWSRDTYENAFDRPNAVTFIPGSAIAELAML